MQRYSLLSFLHITKRKVFILRDVRQVWFNLGNIFSVRTFFCSSSYSSLNSRDVKNGCQFKSPIRLYSTSSSSSSLSITEQKIITALRSVIHPDTKEDIVYSGHVRDLKENNGEVRISLPLDKHYRSIKQNIVSTLTPSLLPFIKNVTVSMYTPETTTPSTSNQSTKSNRSPNLANIRNIIAVSSTKGGVGKSTVAVNIAYSLSQQGHKVGVFDADIFGPSLPTLINEGQSAHIGLMQDDTQSIIPINYMNVKTMSYGYLPDREGAYMRGPMVSNAVRDLLTRTSWGELDYLILDFPPGTGDIQLTLVQALPITAAIIITTPQKLSLIDVSKGCSMFSKVKIPIVALVENMHHFICSNCNTSHSLFPSSPIKQQLINKYNIPFTFQFPLLPTLSYASDEGIPFVLSTPEDNQSIQVKSTYNQIASQLHSHLQNSIMQDNMALSYDNLLHIFKLSTSNDELYIHPKTLRLSCRCAGCVDKMSGKSLLQSERINKNIKPIGMQVRGNYAVAIHWSDGHASSIYELDKIRMLGKQNIDMAEKEEDK